MYDDLNHIGWWWLVTYRWLCILNVGPGYIDDLEDENTDVVEEGYTAELIDIRFVFFSENFN